MMLVAAENLARGKLDFRQFNSLSAALNAMNHQSVYAALALRSSTSTVHVASAAGASVAHVLERIYLVDPRVRLLLGWVLLARRRESTLPARQTVGRTQTRIDADTPRDSGNSTTWDEAA